RMVKKNIKYMNVLKIETEKKIINAAKEVFIEKGLQGARMQEIADRAGINKSLLHYYYRSKDKMFDAVFQDIISQLVPAFSKIVNEDMAIPELLKAFIGFYNEFFQKNPYLPQFFFHEIWQHPDKLAEFISSQPMQPKELAEKMKSKLPPIIESEYLAQHMISNVLGMVLFPHIGRPLFQRLFFENSDDKYNEFLSERTDFLVKMMSGVVSDASIDQNPEDDF
ncbi:MAG: TetR/AcrR family transcriptional regulator, partial [Prolixibacteraceae bacterium]|nr:TetR/AcrR family transcriptional regulator [Prolixibacteraceae bacterium]